VADCLFNIVNLLTTLSKTPSFPKIYGCITRRVQYLFGLLVLSTVIVNVFWFITGLTRNTQIPVTSTPVLFVFVEINAAYYVLILFVMSLPGKIQLNKLKYSWK